MNDNETPAALTTTDALRKRLAYTAEVLGAIQAGLNGTPFAWNAAVAPRNVRRAEELGVTLLTETAIKRRGYVLKARQQPVGRRYYEAPISAWRDLYCLECQAKKVQR